MKNLTALILLSLSACMLLPSCVRDNCTTSITRTRKVPVYASYETFRAEQLSVEVAQELQNPGKIYSTANYLLINEVNKGFHIIDNTLPDAPQPVGFFPVPGMIDMAVKDNKLYCDSYIDLLVIDITDPETPSVIERMEQTFPYRNHINGVEVNEQLGVPIDWIVEEYVEEIDCSELERGNININDNGVQASAGVGLGGSLTRFTIVDNHLYVVSDFALIPFDISNAASPQQESKLNLGFGIETIYPFEDHLYIGSTSAMFIYNISDPANPIKMSSFDHVTSCDPVVTDGRFAYVTLRSGGPCGGSVNELEILDVRDVSNPSLLNWIPMAEPFGMGLTPERLYVCDGYAGLHVYNRMGDAGFPNKLTSVTIDKAYDVIVDECNLIMVGEHGVYQYDICGADELSLRSQIVVNRQN